MDLTDKIRKGGVQGFNAKMLGKNIQGKGDFSRFSYQTDKQYKKNYNKIFRKDIED
tara:strand:+ start:1402 stop:1569 length:168 start_codon:yes stop_codon:yes gene_type:complete